MLHDIKEGGLIGEATTMHRSPTPRPNNQHPEENTHV
jgi:hypothetical protein